MNTRVISANAGYSLGDLLSDAPYINNELDLLGLKFEDQVKATGKRQFVTLVQEAVKSCNVLVIVDGSEDFYTKDVIAQGFNKPLKRNAQAAQAITGYLNRFGRQSTEAAMSYANLPEGAIPLISADTVEQGFVLLYPSVCVAVFPASKKAMEPLFADQFFPLLLKSLKEESYTVSVPIKEESVQDVETYLGRHRSRADGFLPLLCKTRRGTTLRLTAMGKSEAASQQSCDSFLEDLSSEMGNVSTVAGLATKGSRAVKKARSKGKLPAEDFYGDSDENTSTEALDLYNSAELAEAGGKKSRKGKKEKPKRSAFDKVRKFLLTVFVLIFAGSLSYLGWYTYKSAQNRTNYENLRQVYDSPGFAPAGFPAGYNKDFAGLWTINPDIVGWIGIDGTALDYPVVQTTDNIKYYRTDFEGKYSEHAVPFLDADVDLKKPSKNILIYGHNIKTDGQMFNILREYKDLEYYRQHPTVEFNSVYNKDSYKIFSIFYANTLPEHGEIFNYHSFINSSDASATQNYIDQVKARSIFNLPVDVTTEDQLLTLSTCTYEFKEARYVVVARKLRPGEDKSIDAAKAAKNPTPLYPDVWYKLFGGTKPTVAASGAAVSQPKTEAPVENTPPAATPEPEPTPPTAETPKPDETPPSDEATPDKEAPPADSSTDKTTPAEPTPKEDSTTKAEPDNPAADKELAADPQPKEEGSADKPKVIKKKTEQTSTAKKAPATPESPTAAEKAALAAAPKVGVVRQFSGTADTWEETTPKEQAQNNTSTQQGKEDSTTAPPPASEDVSSFAVNGSWGSVSAKANGSPASTDAFELVCRIVEAEMGPTFQPEALKAQAVAAYSYVKYNNAHGTTPWTATKNNVSAKVRAAVLAVEGTGVYYNGALANTTYCASNAGVSNNATNVWGGSLPYLVSVDSPGDTTLRAYGASKSFSVDEVASLIKSYCSVDPYAYGSPQDWFSSPSYDDGKYVDEISVCGKMVSGRNVREGLMKSQINSAAFEVSCDGSNFTFTTYGYGHGVGLSQQGADYYAAQGWNYEEILSHYYPNTQIQ